MPSFDVVVDYLLHGSVFSGEIVKIANGALQAHFAVRLILLLKLSARQRSGSTHCDVSVIERAEALLVRSMRVDSF